MLRLPVALAASFLALAGTARAQVYYVDAVLGDDTNSGTSPATPFRTITRASVAAQSLFSEIQVAAGRYDASIGESFPIVIQGGVEVFGPDPAGGSEAVVVPGAGLDGFHLPAPGLSPRIQWLTVEDARCAFVVDNASDLRGIDVRRCEVAFDVDNDNSAQTTISTSRVTDCDVGVLVVGPIVTLSSTFVTGCRFGVRFAPIAPPGPRRLNLNTSTIRACGVGVDVVDAMSNATLDVGGAAIVECVRGIEVRGSVPGAATVRAFRVTLAGNGTAISIETSIDPDSRVARSIVAGNGVGFAPSAFLPAVFESIVDDGSATGPGVLAVDPLFVDAANGDYSLQRTSPAVDRTTLPAQSEAFEPDGNLDAVGGSDWGAFERLTMEALTDAPVGGSITFEAEGEPGSFGVGIVDRTPFAGPATLTPFGALLLTGPDIQRVAIVSFPAQSPRATWAYAIPNDPSLAGTVWVAQTLVRTSASPSGGALSNAVGFRIE